MALLPPGEPPPPTDSPTSLKVPSVPPPGGVRLFQSIPIRTPPGGVTVHMFDFNPYPPPRHFGPDVPIRTPYPSPDGCSHKAQAGQPSGRQPAASQQDLASAPLRPRRGRSGEMADVGPERGLSHCIGIAFALALPRICIEFILNLYGVCIGLAFDLHCTCIKIALNVHCCCIEFALDVH